MKKTLIALSLSLLCLAPTALADTQTVMVSINKTAPLEREHGLTLSKKTPFTPSIRMDV